MFVLRSRFEWSRENDRAMWDYFERTTIFGEGILLRGKRPRSEI